MRKGQRPVPPWFDSPWSHGSLNPGGGRARSYWEGSDYQDALGEWQEAVFWLGADRLDPKRTGYDLGRAPQIYKVDAVGYESLMLGLILVHYGPPNTECAEKGFPKLTELQMAFSRDGFHWDRTCRDTFIGGKPHDEECWDRAYIHSAGGVCNVVGDKLYFYYGAFQGDKSNLHPLQYWSGMYSNASTGLAVLRRDGFASMESAGEGGALLTRPLTFAGKHLFVNIEGSWGRFQAEVCGLDGKPINGYSRVDCPSINADSTKQLVTWKGGESLEALAGTPVRFKFYLNNAKIYSFWVSTSAEGHSGGAVAAGGPGFTGYWDTP